MLGLFFRASYLLGFKPWDSGVPPPELVAFVEGDGRLPSGKALDVGCGTGTNVIYMAQHGWQATGVDFVPRAIDMARSKAASAGAASARARFLVGDVTRLPELDVGAGHQLLLDVGCFHSIPSERRDAYARGASEVAAPGATMLLFSMIRGEKARRIGPRGVDRGEVRQRFTPEWELVAEEAGRPMLGNDVAWYRLRKRS